MLTCGISSLLDDVDGDDGGGGGGGAAASIPDPIHRIPTSADVRNGIPSQNRTVGDDAHRSVHPDVLEGIDEHETPCHHKVLTR